MTMRKAVLGIAACIFALAVFTARASAGVVTAVVAPAEVVDNVSVGVVAPGPGTLLLLGSGLLGLGAAVRRRQKPAPSPRER
jgi:hypothetical protein